jgi:hypothetical protein
MAVANTGANPPKAKNHRAKTIGELALRNTSTAEEAARYVNQSAYPNQGFRAHHKDTLGSNDLRPTDWAGRAPDERYLIIHSSQDAVTPEE